MQLSIIIPTLNVTESLPLIYHPHLFFLKGLRLLSGDQVMFCRKINFLHTGGFDERCSIMEEADYA